MKDIETLLNKYFEGETTCEEERRLRRFFAEGLVPEHLEVYRPMFAFFEAEQKELAEISGKGNAAEMPELAPFEKKTKTVRQYLTYSLSAAAAAILRGKHKVDFAPHVDCGDHVIIINAEKAILTGKKLEKKFYRHHSGWVGGLKEIRYDHLMRENPEKAMMLAVKGMLPDNTLGRKALTRVRIYKGEQHNNQAQNPTAWTL